MGILAGSLRKGMAWNQLPGGFRYQEPVWSGMPVTNESAMHVAAYFAGVRVIVEDVAKLPFVVYRQTGDRRDRAPDSPYWALIHDRPNPSMTSQQFREFMTAAAINRGNGLALKVGPRGQVPQLLPLNPDTVRIELMPDWTLVYHVTHTDGTQDHLTRDRVFHLPGLSLDGYVGVSVIEYARQTLGNVQGANRQAGTFFGRGMKASGILSPAAQLSKEQAERLKKEVTEATSGENTNSLVVFSQGMSYAPVSVNARDSQFLESRTFEVLEVCRWLRLKPHKIAELTRATFSNIEQESQEHVTDTLMPWGQRWADAMNQQVLPSDIKAELLYDALLRGTTLERYQAYQMAAGGNAPWATRNELRRRENLAPLPGLDEVLQPMNMTGAGQGGAKNGSA